MGKAQTSTDQFADHPWTHARRLARELSKVLTTLRTDPLTPDDVVAVIYPDEGLDYPVGFADRGYWNETVAQISDALNREVEPKDKLAALLTVTVRLARQIDTTITGVNTVIGIDTGMADALIFQRMATQTAEHVDA